jgi:hypothetical protein
MATPAFPAGCAASATTAGYRVESRHGTAALPGIVETLIAAGVAIHAIRVREPDLADVFRRLAGVELTQPVAPAAYESPRPLNSRRGRTDCASGKAVPCRSARRFS